MNWYQRTTNDTANELKSDSINGLTPTEVTTRLQQVGPNELAEQGGRSPFKILWEQLTATMVLILVAAAVISGFLGKWQ